jgi:hypothetical protein
MDKLPTVTPKTVTVKVGENDIVFRQVLVPEYPFIRALEVSTDERDAVLKDAKLSKEEKKAKVSEITMSMLPIVKDLLASTLYMEASDEEKVAFINSLELSDFWRLLQTVLVVSGLKPEEIEEAIEQAKNELEPIKVTKKVKKKR